MDERLKELDNEQLIDTIVNYQKYKYSDAIRDDALRVLKTRKVPKAKLDRLAEKFVSDKRKVEYDKRELTAIAKRYALFAGVSLSVYFLAVVFSPIIWLIIMFITGERADFMLLLAVWLVAAAAAYTFHALAMNKLLAFRTKVGDEITLIQYILFYGILFAVSPVIVIYNLFYMRRRIRKYGA